MQPADDDMALVDLIKDIRDTITFFGHHTPERALGIDDPSTPDSSDADVHPQHQMEGQDIVSRYFGDVRHFSLLNREQEVALWQRIERLKARGRRMLLTSPTALSTLTRVWNQLKHGEVSPSQVMETEVAEASKDAVDAFGDTVAVWCRFADTRPRRVRWQLYGAWHASWSALKCKESLYDMLHAELQRAYARHPNDAEIGAAWRAWSRTQGYLEQVKAHMLQANLRLVVYVARTYRDTDLPLLDLVQEGNLGLMRAIEKFDPQRGVKFVTYAYWWIRQAIGRGIIQQGRTIRLPSHTVERHQKLLATARKFRQVHGKTADNDELGLALGCSPKDIEALRLSTQSVVPLQQAASEDGRELADSLPAAPELAPDARLTQAELRQCIVNCLDALTPREAFILRQRFGFDAEPQSLKQIGETLGLSRERVRQIEKSALERLRQSTYRDALVDFIP